MITNVDDLLGNPSNTPSGVFTNAEQIKGVPVDNTAIGDGKVLSYDGINGKLIYTVANQSSVKSVNGLTGAVVITKSTVGLGNAENTSDSSKVNVINYPTLNTTSKTIVGAINEINSKPIPTGIQTALDTKVDKIVGKGLSTNDLTNELKGQYDSVVLLSHSHTNKTLLDSLVSNGDGSKYLSDDGTYKTVIGGGGSGVDTFVELTDTPSTYVGQENKYVRVNSTADGLEFIEGTGGGVASFTQLNDVPTSYIGQANKMVTVNDTETGLDFTDMPIIPTKTSDLTNDSNFIDDSSYVHTDNNYTTIEKTKLSTIEENAEVNVQSDWNEVSNLSDSFIKNKPTIPTKTSNLTNDSNFVSDSAYVHTDNNYTTTEKTKLSNTIDSSLSIANPSKGYVVRNNSLTEISAYSVGIMADMPDTKIGASGKALVVSADESVYEFSSGNIVNVNADWNSASGDSKILNKPYVLDVSTSTANPTVDYTIKNGVLSVVPTVGGASTFLDLTDTPSTYTGNESKVVSVKSDGTGLEFTTPSSGGGGATLSYKFFQAGNYTFSSSGGATFTPNYSFPNRNYIVVHDYGEYYEIILSFFGKFSSATINGNLTLSFNYTLPSSLIINADDNFPLVYGTCSQSMGVLGGSISYNRISRLLNTSMVATGGLVSGKTTVSLVLTNDHLYYGRITIYKNPLGTFA